MAGGAGGRSLPPAIIKPALRSKPRYTHRSAGPGLSHLRFGFSFPCRQDLDKVRLDLDQMRVDKVRQDLDQVRLDKVRQRWIWIK